MRPLVTCLTTRSCPLNENYTLVTYVATLDVPRRMVEYLARLLATHRHQIGTPPFRQAVLVLRWFREHGCVHCLRASGL